MPLPPIPTPEEVPGFQTVQSVDIDAPASLVWSLITDFSTYPSWNGWVRKVTITKSEPESSKEDDAAAAGEGADSQAAPRTKVRVGDHLEMDLHYPSGKRGKGYDAVVTVDPANPAQGGPELYTLRWVEDSLPGFLLRALRTQTVTARKGGGCTWQSDLKFYGLAPLLVKYLYGKTLDEAITNGTAAGLKREAERLAAEGKATV